MPTRKKTNASVAGAGSVKSTIAGPSGAPPPASLGTKEPAADRLLEKVTTGLELAAQMPHNPTKVGEHGEAAREPQPGATGSPSSELATASTASEDNTSAKVGDGQAGIGLNRAIEALDRVRVDGGSQVLTTNQGAPISENQSSLKIGLRGPTAFEDFILREKITHFDHERIPERVVHARGSGAHGYFECYESLSDLTRAAPFTKAGKRTPVFVRFSTVAGERGSTDLARDVRGFATKFYTDEGNWDLVGNNMPVFFIQDAMKFPDLIHAVKPEPHNAMPQAASAHDTFWDFISLTPESAHMIMWVMSDRAIPRSYRTMQGFGVNTYRLVNQQGRSVFVKFHWNPMAGTHSVVWDEAVKISGADSDFHRRDLWEAIEAGAYPEWEFGIQVFTEEEAETFGFDVLDPTKIVPEEMVPVRPIGKMVLNRNPDNFFAETEQVAFCVANIIPGIDFSNDPLLQGRIHSYFDTQITRLGGPNFHEIPINSSVAPVFNNQRDGMHRQAIHRGRVSYEPNSLAGGFPAQAGMQGYVSFQQMVEGDKVRGKPELFADHYSQATLFYRSQSAVEQKHIIAALRFELTRTQTPAIRKRVLAMLVNVDLGLATAVAEGLGMPVPEALPLATDLTPPTFAPSPTLSLLARPGQIGIKTRRVAILVSPGVDGKVVNTVYASLLADGAVPRLVGSRLGKVEAGNGANLDVEITLEAAPSVLYDAVVVSEVSGVMQGWLEDARAMEFVRDQYRHCKPLLLVGDEAAALLEKAGIPMALADGGEDKGLIMTVPEGLEDTLEKFKTALAGHRAFERETDPPLV